jgi:hypothetical protein
MLTQLRYNLKIVAPTLGWTVVLVIGLTTLVLLGQFSIEGYSLGNAAELSEQFIPLLAAFFTAGVLDAEMKRGAHEVLRSKALPLWQTLGYRILIALVLSFALSAIMLLIVHFNLLRLPVGILLLSAFPPACCMGVISLWIRVRLGNAFMGYLAAIAMWVGSIVMSTVEQEGMSVNPLFSFTSYTNLVKATASRTLESTPYVDWWWVSKIALVIVSVVIFWSITRRVEQLVEAD